MAAKRRGITAQEAERRERERVEEVRAARMRAAAPELLAALRECVGALTPPRNNEEAEATAKAREIINRVDGG